MVTRIRLLLAIAGATALAAAAISLAQSGGAPPGRISPNNEIQPSGRLLTPVGKLTALGNHPAGGALTPNGRFLWALDAGRGINDIKIVDAAPDLACRPVAKLKRKASSKARKRHRRALKKRKACLKKAKKKAGKVVQTIRMPGVSGGIAMAGDGKTAYVSGVADSPYIDEKSPPGTPGLEGDVIHVFSYDKKTGLATHGPTIPVPPPSGTKSPQNFPPTNLTPLSWPRDIGLTRDGTKLLVALNLADSAAIIDLKTKAAQYVKVGSYPYGAAVTRDGKGLVSNEADGTVSVIDLSSGNVGNTLTVGGHLSHPQSIAIDPKRDRAYVAVASEDRIAVIDTKKMVVTRKLSVGRKYGTGTEPTNVSVTNDGCRLLASDSGEDAIAVLALTKKCAKKKQKQWKLIGRVPTASYPVFAAATPKREHLVYVAAKGLGVGPNPTGPNPTSTQDTDNYINSFAYLPSIVSGLAGTAKFPTDKQLRGKLTKRANAQVKPKNAEKPPAGTPLRPGGPIQHVFYIVRENRTYDQVLGDDNRGDGDPKLAILGQNLTPNAHNLAKRFPLLDHVYANSEASIDGHFWTAAGAVSDYVVKNWHQNYAGRGRPYDFGVYAVTWPAKRFLFDAAQDQGISWFNYGEAIAGTVPFPDKDRTPAENQQVSAKFGKSDLGEAGFTLFGVQVPSTNCYPNDASIGKDVLTQQDVYDSTGPSNPGILSRTSCFRQKFMTQVATNNVPAFNYLVLTNDHTNGLAPGRRTPQAMVADNDWALGQIVDTISHSSVWPHSLIVVMEDDSQDGADHVDAHRIPAFVISPYAKRDAVVHTRYDFPSLIRTSELPIGMKPFTLFDALATPMYDAFDSTPQNLEPYDAAAPNIDITATNPATAANKRAARGYDLIHTDRVPQRVLDRQLWQAVHGPHSKPPAPGPHAGARTRSTPTAERG